MKKIITLIITMFTAISMTACNVSKDSNTVATVNNTKITVDQYKNNLILNKKSAEQMYGTNIWDQEVEKGVTYKEKFKDIVLDNMTQVQAIYDEAKSKNILPSKEEVDKTFKEFKASIDSDKDYKKFLKDNNISDKFLKTEQEKFMANNEYEEYFNKVTKVTDKELQDYFNKHKEDFYQVKASHILISTLDKDGKKLSDKKKQEAKKKAEEVLKKVKSGEDFATLAKENSDDTSNAKSGGDLGFFKKGVMVKAFEDAAFKLKKGEVSGLVETEYGYHIIKVTDKIDENSSLNDVKDDVKLAIMKEKYNEKLESIKKSAKIEKNEDVVKKVKY